MRSALTWAVRTIALLLVEHRIENILKIFINIYFVFISFYIYFILKQKKDNKEKEYMNFMSIWKASVLSNP